LRLLYSLANVFNDSCIDTYYWLMISLAWPKEDTLS